VHRIRFLVSFFALAEVLTELILQQRTKDTAAPIVSATGAELEFTPLLQERSFGELRGHRFSYLEEKGIRPFSPDYTPPNGESVLDFAERADKAWAYVIESLKSITDGKVLVVVTHGLVLSHFAKNYLETSEEDRAKHIVPFLNTSLSFIDREPHPRTNRFPIKHGIFNCDAHLSEDDRDPNFGVILGKV